MRQSLVKVLAVLTWVVLPTASALAADELKPIAAAEVKLDRPVDFEKDIYPILEEHCVACHNVAIDESKFVAEDADSILKGGKRGPAVIPKDPEKSLLFKVVSRSAQPAMPPLPNNVDATALSPEQVGLIRQWILEGAAAGSGSSNRAVQWHPLPPQVQSIYSVALSPWGRFAAAGRANQISIYDLASQKEVARLKDPNLNDIQYGGEAMYPGGASHRDFVHALAFSPDGKTLASGGYRVVKLWERSSDLRTHQLKTAGEILAVAISADGKLAATALADKTVQLWDLQKGAPSHKLAGHTEAVKGLHFWPTAEEYAAADKKISDAKAQVDAAQTRLDAAHKAVESFDPKKQKLDAEKEKAEREKLAAAVTAAEQALEASVAAVGTAETEKAAFEKQVAETSKLFTGSADKTVRVWDVATGKEIQSIETTAPIHDVTANKDATQVIAAHEDNTLRVWAVPAPGEAAKPAAEAKEGEEKPAEPPKPVAEMKGHAKPVAFVELIQPAATQVVSGSEDGTVRIWNISNGSAVRSINLGVPVTGIAARPDGTAVAAIGNNGIARIWDMNGTQKAEMKGDVRTQHSTLLATDDQNVTKQLVALADTAIKAAEKNQTDRQDAAKKAKEAKDAADKAVAEAKKKFEDLEKAAATAKEELAKKPDDAALKKKSTDADQAAAKQKEELNKAVDGQTSAQRSLELSEKAVKTAETLLNEAKAKKETLDKKQVEVDEALKKAQEAETASVKPGAAIAYSPDGGQLVTGADDQLLHIWNGIDGTPLEVVAGHSGAVKAVTYGPNNVLFSAAGAEAASWNTNPSWNLVATLGPKADAPLEVNQSAFISRVLALSFSHDGKLLATGGGDPSRSGELIIWDVAKRTPVQTLADAHSDTVFGLEFSRDDQQILSGAADKFVKIFDLATGKHVRSFEGHTHHVLDVSWKADGSQIASAGADNAIKVWNVETGEQIRTIANYAKQVTSLKFVGVGENIVSCGGDATVRLHRTSNGQNYRSFSGATDFMYSAASSRDEAIVIAGGEDGVLRVWNGTNGQSIATFEPPKPAGAAGETLANKQAQK